MPNDQLEIEKILSYSRSLVQLLKKRGITDRTYRLEHDCDSEDLIKDVQYASGIYGVTPRLDTGAQACCSRA